MYFDINAISHPPQPLPPRDETIFPLITGATTALLILALITVALRIWVRTKEAFLLGWDDATMIVATIVTIANWAVLLAINIKTGGLHTWFIPPTAFEDIAKVAFVFVTLWVWSVSLVKVSVCFMLLRIKSNSRPWRIGLWALIVLIAATAVGTTVAYMLMCNPIQANWELKYMTQPERCWSVNTFINFTYSFSTLFAITDVACALLPIAFIKNIHRPFREKCTLAILMALGLLACVCGLMKMVLLRSTLTSSDPVFKGATAQIWASAEAYIGIIAANIPCLKSMLETVFRLFGGRITSALSSRRGGLYTGTQDDEEHFELGGKKTGAARRETDISYHSAVRSMHTGKNKPLPLARSGSERDLIHGPGRAGDDGGFKGCYVTKEYEVSWEETKR